jgi:hypothetical protein
MRQMRNRGANRLTETIVKRRLVRSLRAFCGTLSNSAGDSALCSRGRINGTKVADRTRSQCTAGRITIQVAPFSQTSPGVVHLFSAVAGVISTFRMSRAPQRQDRTVPFGATASFGCWAAPANY